MKENMTIYWVGRKYTKLVVSNKNAFSFYKFKLRGSKTNIKHHPKWLNYLIKLKVVDYDKNT